MKEEITPEDALEHYRTKRTSHCGVSSPVQPMLPGWGCLVGCVLTGEAGGAIQGKGKTDAFSTGPNTDGHTEKELTG